MVFSWTLAWGSFDTLWYGVLLDSCLGIFRHFVVWCSLGLLLGDLSTLCGMVFSWTLAWGSFDTLWYGVLLDSCLGIFRHFVVWCSLGLLLGDLSTLCVHCVVTPWLLFVISWLILCISLNKMDDLCWCIAVVICGYVC